MVYNKNLEDVTSSVLAQQIRQNNTKSYIIIGMGIIIITLCIIICVKQNTITYLREYAEETDEYLDELVSENNFYMEIGEQVTLRNTPQELNDSTLYEYLVKMGAWYPEILVAQAKLESANYTSNLLKNNNNLFGMKIVNYRNTTQTGYNGLYGTYINWKLSCIDRILWDNYQFNEEKPTKEEYYINLLHFGYATDENYINKLKSIENDILFQNK